MIAYCIPTMGRSSLGAAVGSALRDQTVLIRESASGEGPQAARNWLLNEAERIEADYIRWGDDDDLCIGGVRLLSFFTLETDVVYFDYIRYGEIIRLGSDPVAAMFRGVTPWCFAARISALRAAGLQWDESKPCRQGSWFWLAALRAGLRFNYAPVIAYEKVAPGAISSKPEFAAASREFFAAAREWAGERCETHYRAALRNCS
jgi:hypothetical protein